jgi:hypothetical protein
MTDLELIKHAAQVTTDANGNPVVQIPLDLWESYLEQVEPETVTDEPDEEFDPDNPPPGSLALLAKLAREANIRTGERDTSSRSREILENEYADYLLKRVKQGNGDEE